MSNMTIKTEKELQAFLKIVSEEAYKKSLRESSDPFVEKYNSVYHDDEKRYGSLDEVEEETPDEGEAEEAGEDEPVDAEEAVESEEARAVSFDSIKKAIKILRSGKSVDSESVDDNLNVYYDRLDEEERLVLFTFLDELSKIMNLSIEGGDAQDPGDPPLNIDFVTGEQEADDSAEATADDAAEEGGEAAAEVEGEDEEDTSPPIEVNESQRKDMLRRKIRYLMSR
tara:strand:- start:175 stop:852 length:678 start_codon:yes stop_codon:yes gene_type:complete